MRVRGNLYSENGSRAYLAGSMQVQWVAGAAHLPHLCQS